MATRPSEARAHGFAVSWLIGAIALLVGAFIVPGASTKDFGAVVATAAIVAVLNAVLPPIVAALRLPFMLLLGFLLVLVLDALMLLAADAIGLMQVDSFWLGAGRRRGRLGGRRRPLGRPRNERRRRLLAARDAADRAGARASGRSPNAPESSSWRSTASHCPCSSGRCATATPRRWPAGSRRGRTGSRSGRPNLSSQTGASQAGILLGSNEDIPAFRWVEKENGRIVVCSSPSNCAELERAHSTGKGLLADGGASRGNLFSGDADHMILTVSRMDVEKRASTGYRAFLANGFNVMRTFVLTLWEVVLEWTAAAKAKRRDVQPRGHRGGLYPFMRAALCVFVRDLIVYGVPRT